MEPTTPPDHQGNSGKPADEGSATADKSATEGQHAFVTIRILGIDGFTHANLAKDRMVVGCSFAADLPIMHTSVTRKHCVFTREGDAWFVENIDSSHGYRVNKPQAVISGKVKLSHNGIEHVCGYHADRHGETFVTVDGLQIRVCTIQVADQRWHVQVGGVDLWLEDSTLAAPSTSTGAAGSAEVRAKFNGKVIAIHAEIGAIVKRGDTLLVIESMKLEHAIAATQDGVVAGVEIALGQQATTGQILVKLNA